MDVYTSLQEKAAADKVLPVESLQERVAKETPTEPGPEPGPEPDSLHTLFIQEH